MSCTLKDIAKRAGVSTVTVHKCIYDKPGIGEKTRKRVLSIVEDMNYSINPAASSLKRVQIRIVVISPSLKPKLNYFFQAIDEGIYCAESELNNFNVSLIRMKCGDDPEYQIELLKDIVERDDINGLVIYCLDDTRLNPYFKLLEEKGIPVVTFHSDAVDSCRIACVTAPDKRTGSLAAELMSKLIARNKRIIVLGGSKMLKVLRDNTLGFYSYMSKYRPDLTILEINDLDTIDNLKKEIEKVLLAFDDIAGIYNNSARNNIPLCEVLHDNNLSQNIVTICTDVYEELRPFMEDGTITATMWQDPKSQSYKAIMYMYHYLTSKKMVTENLDVKIGIVMMNNFDDYI